MKYFIFLITISLQLTAISQHKNQVYLDQSGLECVLTWNENTGKSTLYYYSSTDKKFLASPYQLPEKPTGDEGKYGFDVYIDQNGLECVLTWNYNTGTSNLFYYDNTKKAFEISPYQIPTKPTGDEGEYEFDMYVDQSKLECVLAWNSTSGASKLYYYSSTDKKFVEANYQLPTPVE